MKIAIVGVGAMGSVYAGLLGSAGHEVWAVDPWQEHVDAIGQHGLRLEGASGDRTVDASATTDAAEVGEVDLVVVATKAHDVEAAASRAPPSLGDGHARAADPERARQPAIGRPRLGEDRTRYDRGRRRLRRLDRRSPGTRTTTGSSSSGSASARPR